jgi:hypothetical protein
MVSILISAAVLCATPNDEELIQTLMTNWQSQREAIATARFRARAFRHGSLKALSGEQVEAVFASVDLGNKPDDLRKVVSEICTVKEFTTPEPWSVIEVTVDGAKHRERRTNVPEGVEDNVVGEGVTVLGLGPAKQTSIVRSSANTWKVRDLDDFRFIPKSVKGFFVSRPQPGHVFLSSEDDPAKARIKLDVDEATGFVHSQRIYDDGVLLKETLQFGPVTYPGDLMLPTAIAKLAYHGGVLKHANILVVENAEVNVDLPTDAFVTNAKKGTLIVDDRDPQHKEVFFAKSDIDDVAKAFPLSPSSPSSPPSVERSPTALLAFAGTALVVVALLVFFYRRPRSAR